jgi:hypothetical protein
MHRQSIRGTAMGIIERLRRPGWLPDTVLRAALDTVV